MDEKQTNLADLIASKGLKQWKLAKKIGVTEATMSRWCNGWYEPSRFNVHNLAIELGVERSLVIDAVKQTAFEFAGTK